MQIEIISISILFIKSSIISLIQKRIKKKLRNVIVYVNKIVILNVEKNVNILITHRFLSIKQNYFFESISRVNLTIDQMIIAIQIVSKSEDE